jgi:pyruvate kinase
LGLETPISQVPLRQKEIIEQCLAAAKPVICATEMLGSMQYNPRPTRAEVSDVSNAVFDHTDAVMLSGETAMGRYPARVVRMMSEIITATETSTLLSPPPPSSFVTTESASPLAIAESVITLAQTLEAKAIVVTTQSGYFARSFSRLRPNLPLLALSPSTATAQRLLLSWGVTPVVVDDIEEEEKVLKAARDILQRHHSLKKGDHILLVSSSPATTPRTGDHTIVLTRF